MLEKTKLQNKNTNKLKLFNRVVFSLIIMLGASYLVGVNDLSIKTLVLQQQKKKIFKLKNDANDLELRVMSLSSYNNLSERLNGLDLVKVDKISYVNGASAVALRK